MSRSARGCAPSAGGRACGNPLRNTLIIALAVLLPTLVSGFIIGVSGAWNKDWRTARRESSGIAPDPARTPEAVVQEGLEINFLGLVFGVDVARPALKLPFVERIGLSRDPAEG